MEPGSNVYAKGDKVFATTAFDESLHDVVQVTVVMRVKGIGFRCLGTEVSLGIIYASIYVCIRPPADDEFRLIRGWVLFDDWSFVPVPECLLSLEVLRADLYQPMADDEVSPRHIHQ